jgi:hypothetical protein
MRPFGPPGNADLAEPHSFAGTEWSARLIPKVESTQIVPAIEAI